MNNYPIKYAVMPVYEHAGCVSGLNSLERDYEVICNIVSPCYLVSETKKYMADGNTKEKYEVVFPYDALAFSHNDGVKRNIPEINYNGDCYNSISVSSIFDSYEEANSKCRELNEDILNHSFVFLPVDDDFLKNMDLKLTEHLKLLEKYSKVEETIIGYSKDLINNSKVLIKKDNR